jgi:Barstar (barnase inhibitor)
VREYVVDLSAVTSWADFIAAFNEGFVQPVGGDWNGNLDAFNDYLWWDRPPYRLVIRGWKPCADALHQSRTWDQRPVLEVIVEIFRDNPQVEVILT